MQINLKYLVIGTNCKNPFSLDFFITGGQTYKVTITNNNKLYQKVTQMNMCNEYN